jgi:peptide/nickel transport system ATP-binding protein
VGLVFQDPMTRLNPLLTIGDHLGDTLAAHRPRWQRRKVRQRAETLLTRVGIGPERYGSYPHEFSGGMRQRLAIALAMALEPPLVIADEPTTSLDVAVAGQVMAELSNLCREAGSALLLISHDLAMAGRWCDQIAVLDQGRLVEQAPARQLLMAPASALAQRLVAKAREREGAESLPPPPAPLLLEIEQLRSWHPLPSLPWQARWLKAVDGISLRLQQGETIGLVLWVLTHLNVITFVHVRFDLPWDQALVLTTPGYLLALVLVALLFRQGWQRGYAMLASELAES